jgi:hypothetical protein
LRLKASSKQCQALLQSLATRESLNGTQNNYSLGWSFQRRKSLQLQFYWPTRERVGRRRGYHPNSQVNYTDTVDESVLTSFLVTQGLSSRGSLRPQKTRSERHTRSFLLGRLVSASPQSCNSSATPLSATISITATSISSIIPTSRVVLITRVRPTQRISTNSQAITE